MSPRAGGKWREEHTATLNAVVGRVWQRLPMSLVEPTAPLRLHADANDTDISVVLTQGTGAEYRVVGMGGRKLAIQEAEMGMMERLLVAALWGVKRWGRYTYFTPQLIIVLPGAVEAQLAAGSKDPPVRL